MTWLTPGTSSPRAATSEATRTMIAPDLKRSSSRMRSACSMSPWICPATSPAFLSTSASSRTSFLRLQKTMAFLTSGSASSLRSVARLPRLVVSTMNCAIERVGRRRARDLDLLGVGHEAVGELLDRARHRRREQQRLADARQLGADFLDIGDEAHVEHAVGLVDDQQAAGVEHDLAAPEQVHQPARASRSGRRRPFRARPAGRPSTRRRSAAPC